MSRLVLVFQERALGRSIVSSYLLLKNHLEQTQDITESIKGQEISLDNYRNFCAEIRYILAVEKKLLTLSEYVRMIKDKKDLSAQAIADRANKVCKPLKEFKPQYVNDVVNNEFGQPTISKLQELAAGLGVPEEEIFLVARGLPISPENAPYNEPEAKLLRWWRRLTDKQQEVVIDVIRAQIGKNMKGSNELTDKEIEDWISQDDEP